jgi:simple sugar transport system ATP-binding protein
VALRDVSLAVRRGTIHGLLGENGAGKSTLVSLISGQRQPTSGTISLDGRGDNTMPTSRKWNAPAFSW